MRYIIALLVSFLCIPNALALCYWNDVECLAPFVLPMYDPDITSIREWSAYNGITFGYGNRIITRVRFDQAGFNFPMQYSDPLLMRKTSLKAYKIQEPFVDVSLTFAQPPSFAPRIPETNHFLWESTAE